MLSRLKPTIAMCCDGGSPCRSATVRPSSRSPSTCVGSKPTPQASSRGPRSRRSAAPSALPICAAAGSFSDCGSTKASSLPPRMTNWSMAYSVCGDRSLRMHEHQHVVTSSSIVWTSPASVLHVQQSPAVARCSPSLPACGRSSDRTMHRRAARRCRPIIGRFGLLEAINQARDVVFEELLLVRLEELDDFAAVGRIRAGQSEIQRLAARRRSVRPARPNSVARSSSSEKGLRIDHRSDAACPSSAAPFLPAVRGRAVRRRASAATGCSLPAKRRSTDSPARRANRRCVRCPVRSNRDCSRSDRCARRATRT